MSRAKARDGGRYDSVTVRRAFCTLIGLALGLALAEAPADEIEKARSQNPGSAQYHWVMHCQGCHGAEAAGTPGSVPRLAGSVSRFLQVKGGREYLGRVPGVAFVELSDSDTAALLNWVLRHFDGGDLPKTFAPYSAEEMQSLRREPLISDAYRERRRLLQSLARGR